MYLLRPANIAEYFLSNFLSQVDRIPLSSTISQTCEISSAAQKQIWQTSSFEKIVQLHKHFNARLIRSGTAFSRHVITKLTIRKSWFISNWRHIIYLPTKFAQNYWRCLKTICWKFHLEWSNGSKDIGSIIATNSWNTLLSAANSIYFQVKIQWVHSNYIIISNINKLIARFFVKC